MEVVAMGYTEHIRLAVVGNRLQILHGDRWSGSSPDESTFLDYAKEALEGCYMSGSYEPKPGYGVLRGGVPVPEAIRFMGEDGRERWRYSIYDLYKSRRVKL
jgi:hypothetical protein